MKKKILLALGILCILLLSLSLGDEKNDSQITYGITVDDGKNDSQITYEITVDSGTNVDLSQRSTEGLLYYDSMEEAMKNANPKMFEGYECAREPDTIVKIFETDTEALMFYISYESARKGVSNIAKFEKQTVDGKEQYGLVFMTPDEITKSIWEIGYEKNPEKNVRFSIQASSLSNMLGYRVGEEGERFVWGITKLSEVQNLVIDGQRPDEVIQYQEFDKDWYFWYYTDLESDSSIEDLVIEFVEE